MGETEKSESKLSVDISSKLLELGFEKVSNFISKLISPTVEEIGVLLSEKVTFWRFKNQIKILDRAKEYCEENNISPKSIPLKVLVPLLENASLEEDEYIKDKWSILIGNMADSENNMQNNIFPFILSQISKDEFIKLENQLKTITSNLDKIAKEISDLEAQFKPESISAYTIESKIDKLQQQIPHARYVEGFTDFELANLTRCGLLRAIPIQQGFSQANQSSGLMMTAMNAYPREVKIEHIEDQYVFTDLGVTFMELCEEKNRKK